MKKEEKTKQTCEKIIYAATIEFGSKPYDAVSLNAICNKYHIAKGLIYHNFKNKDELYLCCVGQSFERLMAYLEKVEIEASTASVEIRNFLERREAFFEKNPYDRNIFFNVMLYPAEHLREKLLNVTAGYDAYIRKEYHQLLSKIRLRDGISMEMAEEYLCLFQNMYNGYYQNKISWMGNSPELIRERDLKISELLDIILYGISTEEKVKKNGRNDI